MKTTEKLAELPPLDDYLPKSGRWTTALVIKAMQDYARAALAATPAAPSVKQTPVAARKVEALIEQGYVPVGYVLEKAGERNAVTRDAAVAWLTDAELSTLLFVDGREITGPSALTATPAAPPLIPDEIHEILCATWNRSISADEALEQIEDLLIDARAGQGKESST